MPRVPIRGRSRDIAPSVPRRQPATIARRPVGDWCECAEPFTDLALGIASYGDDGEWCWTCLRPVTPE